MPGRKSSKTTARKSSRSNRRLSRRTRKRTSKHVRSRQALKQTRRRQRGGRVGMPVEYYGGNSGRFSANAGASCRHAYGDALSQSHGTDREGGVVGPNLAVYPNSSLLQTGGKRKRSNARKSRGRKSVRKSRGRKPNKVVRRRRR